ncbi:MAG: YraN family protein [candidate division WOR-3 bacterium]
MNKGEKGKKGEEIAKRFLEGQGYKVIEQNYRTRFGEIDLICEKGNSIIFVEVRQKSGRQFGEPVESIDKRKIGKIKRTAEHFLSERGIYEKEIRFDLFSIIGKKFELIPNVF